MLSKPLKTSFSHQSSNRKFVVLYLQSIEKKTARIKAPALLRIIFIVEYLFKVLCSISPSFESNVHFICIPYCFFFSILKHEETLNILQATICELICFICVDKSSINISTQFYLIVHPRMKACRCDVIEQTDNWITFLVFSHFITVHCHILHTLRMVKGGQIYSQMKRL